MKRTRPSLDMAACAIPRPSGMVKICVRCEGRTVAEIDGHNLFVNAGLPALASLLGGDTAGQYASAVGFGSGSAAPTVGDSGLTAPAYYKALDSHAENGTTPGSGSVQFNWSLTASDSGAMGLVIQELGLFANPTGITLPGTNSPTILLARKTIAPITFGAGMSLSGTWTLTF
jgi:hypothetical protein